MAEELTVEQQRALALAAARKRASEVQPSALGELGHGAGLVARSLVNAGAALPAMGADAVTGMLNQFLPEGRRFKAQLPLINDLLTKYGLPVPRDAAERVLSDLLTAETGAGLTSKAGQLAGGAAKELFSQNIPTQINSAITGQAGSSIAREVGAGPVGQFFAGLGGSMVPTTLSAAMRGIAPNFTQAGRDDTKGRLLNKAAGGQKDAVLQGLDENRSYVPGERPTTSQAAVNAGAPTLAAVEKEVVSKYRPDLLLARDAENEAARLAAVRAVGKDETALLSAQGSRSALANQEYGAAKAVPVRGDPALAKLLQDPFIKKEIPDALDLLKGRPAKENLTEFLQNVKIGIDQKLSKTGNDALSSAQKSAAQDAKEKLLLWLDTKNPAYQTARSNFAQRSEPINQMQVGRYLENKLTSPMGTERAGVFAQALRDAPGTIKRSAGGPRFENLSDVLSAEQVGLLGGVRSSLARDLEATQQASLGGSAAKGLLGSEFAPVETPQLLNRAVSTARFVLEKIGVNTKNKSLQELAREIQDPTRTAELMRKATPNQWAAMQEVVKASTPASLLGNIQTWQSTQP